MRPSFRHTRLALPLGVMLTGLLLSALLGRVLQHQAIQDWHKRAEHEAARRSVTLIGWMEESYATLSALVALVENSDHVDSGEFLNAVDGLEARTKVNFMPAKALLALDKTDWKIQYSSAPSNADAAFPRSGAPLPPLLQKVVALAENTPNEWFLSAPFSSSDAKQFVYVVMVPVTRTDIALVGVLAIQRMAETLLETDGSDGLTLALTLKPQDDATGSVIRVTKGDGAAVHQSDSLTQTGHANLELMWQFAPSFDGGVDRRLSWSVGGACGVASALLALFVLSVQQQRLRTERKVADATGELALALEQAEVDARAKAQIASLLLDLQRVSSYDELSSVLFPGLAALLHLGQASLYRAEPQSAQLVLCGAYAREGKLALADTIGFGEGLVGQCALERRSIHLATPPADYITVSTGLATATPAAIVLVPIVSTGALLGVIELASLQPYSDVHRKMLDHLLPMVAMAMEVIARNEGTQRLLRATQEQAQTLEAQGNEIAHLLKEQESIFQNAPHGIIYTGDGIILRANQRVAEYFRTTIDHLVGQPSESIYSSVDDFRRLGAIVGPQLAEGKDVHLEWEFLRKDGTPFVAMISGQAISLSGHARSAVWMFEDITERRAAQAAVIQERLQLRKILESSPVGVSINTQEGIPIFANHQMSHLLGLPIETILQKPTTAFWKFPDERRAFIAQLQRDGQVKDFPAELLHSGGQTRTVLISANSINEGDSSHMVSWIYDVTERQKSLEL